MITINKNLIKAHSLVHDGDRSITKSLHVLCNVADSTFTLLSTNGKMFLYDIHPYDCWSDLQTVLIDMYNIDIPNTPTNIHVYKDGRIKFEEGNDDLINMLHTIILNPIKEAQSKKQHRPFFFNLKCLLIFGRVLKLLKLKVSFYLPDIWTDNSVPAMTICSDTFFGIMPCIAHDFTFCKKCGRKIEDDIEICCFCESEV